MRYTLGQVTEFPAPAGEIGGIALLLADVQQTAADASQFLSPGFQFRRSVFDSLMARFRRREGESNAAAASRLQSVQQSLSSDEIQQLIAGTVGQIAAVSVQAKMIAMLPVRTTAERDANLALQASLIDPARLMWSSLDGTIRNMQARAQATSGLGAWPVAVIVALIVAGAILLTAGIVAITYLVDAHYRLNYASDEAANICRQNGGCSPEQQALIQQQLSIGPFDRAMMEFMKQVGPAVGTAIIVLSVGGAVAGAGALWYYVLGGREWIRKKMEARR